MALAAAPDIPGYRALSPLGYGPTSTLYSAQSTSLGRWVALTVYSTTLTDDRAQRRFTRAFETARRLGSHPHAVTMLECGLTSDRQPYVATEIYERGTLDGRVAGRKPLELDEALRMAIAVAGALETAHRADVVHGGVHPARVLVGSDGEPALTDLGLVALVERGGLAALVGPMSYHTAPEVLEGEPVSPATDVYSLASTLYTVLTGRPPYQGAEGDDTVASLLLRILQHAVPPIGGDVPRSLEHLLHQALSCEPKDRPERALAFARALQGCQAELHLPVTEPVVLDIAASLRLAGGDEAPEPVQRVFIPYPAPDPAAPDPAEPGGPAVAEEHGAAPQAYAPFPALPAPPAAPSPASPSRSPSPPTGTPLLPHDPSPPQAPSAFEPRLAPVPDAAPASPAALWPPTLPGAPGAPEPAVPSPASGGPDDGDDPSNSPWPDLPLDPPLRPARYGGDTPAEDEPEAESAPDSEPEGEAQGAAAGAGDPATATGSGEMPAVPHGPRALPVLVLMGLVAVLIAGVGWMIVTGENPTQEETAQATTRSSRALDGSGAGPGRSGGGQATGVELTATENATGVQLDWEDSGQGNQVVLVLSAAEAPRALPAETGTALLVPTAGLLPQTGYCFAVVSAGDGPPEPAALAARLPSRAIPPAACIRGATDATVRRQ